MALLSFGCAGPGCSRQRALAWMVFLLFLGVPPSVCAADLTVIMDQARLLKLPDKVATIVIGNPLIADVSLQQGGMMVITGKGYGVTNLVVMDRAGTVLLDKSVEVQGPDADVVVLYRGIERETYSCTPICERRLTLGDGNVVFDTGAAQTGIRNGLAQGAPPPTK